MRLGSSPPPENLLGPLLGRKCVLFLDRPQVGVQGGGEVRECFLEGVGLNQSQENSCIGFCKQDYKITFPRHAWFSLAALQPGQLGDPRSGGQDTWEYVEVGVCVCPIPPQFPHLDWNVPTAP